MKRPNEDLQQPVVAAPLGEIKADTEMEEPARCAVQPEAADLYAAIQSLKKEAAEWSRIAAECENLERFEDAYRWRRLAAAQCYIAWHAHKLLPEAESEGGTTERRRNATSDPPAPDHA